MLNPISFIYLFIKKNITRRGATIFVYFILFVSLFFLLIRWNTVPSINDELIFDYIKNGKLTKDSTKRCSGLDIVIEHPYFAHDNDRFETKFGIKYWQNISREYIKDRKSPTINAINQLGISNTKIDSIRNFVADSISSLLILRLNRDIYKDIPYFTSKTKNGCFEYLIADSLNIHRSVNNLSYVKSDIVGNCGGLQHKLLYIFTNKTDEIFYSHTPPVALNIKMTKILKHLVMHDMAQSYYSLKITNNHDLTSIINDSITVKIDFCGATRFSGIYPTPDEISISSIKYTNPDKIKQIIRQGEIKMYCQFLETTGVQSTRIYIISTLATFFFGLFAKGLLETNFLRLFKRKKKLTHK